MARDPLPTYCFALVVVRKHDRFLLVHEHNRDKEWYLPAGRVEAGESFNDAAVRETLEEAGVPVRLTGIIRVEHTPHPDFGRLRVVFLAEPIGDAVPKREADGESLGAEWVRVDELSQYALRGDEVRDVLQYLASGGAVCPLTVFQAEMMPYGGA